jgi:hypothetical protein
MNAIEGESFHLRILVLSQKINEVNTIIPESERYLSLIQCTCRALHALLPEQVDGTPQP